MTTVNYTELHRHLNLAVPLAALSRRRSSPSVIISLTRCRTTQRQTCCVFLQEAAHMRDTHAKTIIHFQTGHAFARGYVLRRPRNSMLDIAAQG